METTYHFIRDFFISFVDLSLEMAPYLLFGFLIAGILHVYFPENSVHKYFGKKGLRSSVNAALLGVPLPLCSCGVIPSGIAFHQKGASKGSTLSFLVSTPQTGVDSILVTYSLLGLPFAILRPVIAFITGIVGGWITDKNVSQEEFQPTAFAKNNNKSENGKIVNMLRFAFIDFMNDISKWLVIGLVLAALINVVVPDDFFGSAYLSNPMLNMLIVLAASIPIYVCATGSVPIAAVLLMKGLSPGAILVFLMAGPATNAASITVIGNTLGKKFLRYYLGVIVVGSLFFGWLLDYIFPEILTSSSMDITHSGNHILPYWVSIGSAVILAFAMILALMDKKWNVLSKSKVEDIDADTTVIIGGMTCNHCKMNIENNLGSMENVEAVRANIINGHVQLSGKNINMDSIEEKVSSLGYDFKGKV